MESNGELIRLGSNSVSLHVRGEETGGAYSVMEMVTPPDGITPAAHRHAFAETFYVLEGVLGGKVEGQPFEAAAGSSVHVPGGLAHVWWNAGSEPVRVLIICAPGGFESFFEDLAEATADLPPGPPDMEQVRPIIGQLWEKYGVEPAGAPAGG